MTFGEQLRGKHADFEACRLILGVAHLSARAEDGTRFDYDGRVLHVEFPDGQEASLDAEDLADAKYEMTGGTS